MKTIFTIILLCALVLGIGSCAAGCGQNYSEGSRMGVVTKVSYKGLIWKSWEGQLNMGGVRERSDGKGVEVNVFEFNASPPVVEQLNEAMRSGKRVELVYHEWFIGPIEIENSHVVVAVKPAE